MKLNFKLSLKPPFIIHSDRRTKVISSSGERFFTDEIELVSKEIPVKRICRGCLFEEKDFTCKYKEMLKMPISCMDVDNSNYQPKK
jgi:acyl-CoA synthetase (AMP-forming)/AMP-acid ligase II